MKKISLLVLLILVTALASGVALAAEHKVDPNDKDFPEISYVLNGNEVTFTVYDEDKIRLIVINGEEINIEEPKATVTHTVKNLKKGKNQFKITGVDLNERCDIKKYTIEIGENGQIDSENPKIELKLITGKAIVTITDDVEIAKLIINNKEIDITKSNKIIHNINILQQGKNDISVVAIDSSGKSLTKNYSVDYNDGVCIDLVKPQVSSVVSGQDVIITITDNIGLALIMINSEIFNNISDNVFTHKISNLKPGSHNIKIEVCDVNAMGISKKIRVEIEEPVDETEKEDEVGTVTDPKGSSVGDTQDSSKEHSTDNTAPINPKSKLSVSFSLNEKTEFGLIESKNGITMVPVRFGELLGASVEWFGKTNTVKYTCKNKIVEIKSGNNMALVNGQVKELEVTPYINSENRMMVPIRMIAEELGYSVKFISNTKPIVIE
ncbi:copper amine oxidase N-terminal domain-containing protein [Clostridium sp. 'deep sea']|uniref:stalk domain-containing protein n=1 Tax=Clostridium sp. 'deep sea' TaxID=2779445 RepID=UPI0018966F24|nr:stalk domain-containing protein [Clostridium sp. 'deep sea']QOR33625.1 copper amine oxidase N-terminal domain-containing protein [Clostridium sp. 'deep sea']